MRELFPAEKHVIADLLQDHYNLDEEERADILNRIEYAVCFDDYMSDTPGFAGSLYFIVWGGPERITYIARQYNEPNDFRILFDGEIPVDKGSPEYINAVINRKEVMESPSVHNLTKDILEMSKDKDIVDRVCDVKLALAVLEREMEEALG